MIVQPSDDGLLLFKQTDHALLSAAFATAWGNDQIPALTKREELLVAAARHDDGWAEWELAPRLDAAGRPVDFIHIPVSEHVVLYKRGIDLVEAEDGYAGLVASMHGERLYTRPFHPGMDPRIDHLKDDDLALARTYVQGEHDRQQRLLVELSDEDLTDAADEAWRLLQVWDRLSLLVCLAPIDAKVEQTMPLITGTHGDVRIEIRGDDGGVLRLDPYPFTCTPAEFTIEARHTSSSRWDSDEDFRRDYRASEPVLLSFRCESG